MERNNSVLRISPGRKPCLGINCNEIIKEGYFCSKCNPTKSRSSSDLNTQDRLKI